MSLPDRLRNLFRKPDMEHDLDDELGFHIGMRRDEYLASGLTPAEAEQRARQDFGNVTHIREETRSMNLMLWLETLLQDVRVGARQIRRNLSLSLTSIATLALGMGATTAIFTLADSALLRPLPYPQADRIVALQDQFPGGAASPTIPEFLDFQAANESFDQMAFFDSRDYQITGSDDPQRVVAARVTAGFFPLFSAQPTLGRVFEEAEIANGASDAVVLSHAFWQRAFGADTKVLGRRLDVNGVSGTVIGVLAPGFSVDFALLQFNEPVDIYVPYPMTPNYLSRSGPDAARRRVSALARLKPLATIESAKANMQIIADRLTREYPALYRQRSGETQPLVVNVQPLRNAVLGNDRTTVKLLAGAICFILLLACANTMQARLAHGLTRHREFAVRGAIGAGRPRLIRQLLVESLVLAGIAGIAGMFVARGGLSLLLVMIPQNPMFDHLAVDARVFAFMGGLLLLTTVLCGLAPAFVVSRASSPLMLRTASATGGASHDRLRGILVISQVALALVLLFGAGLLFRTLIHLQSTVSGFSADNVLTMQMRMRFQRASTFTYQGLAWQRVVGEVERAPGVEAAALATGFPQGGGEFLFTMARSEPPQSARSLFVSPGFFATLQIPLLAGRTFTHQDTPDRPRVVVISEDMARRFWPGQSVVGQTIDGPRQQQYTIVGVAGTARVYGSASAPTPQVYLPYLYTSEPNQLLVVRARPGVADVFPAVREAVRQGDAGQPVFRVRSLGELIAAAETGPRTLAILSGAFAFMGIALAATGLYGAVSYMVTQRVPEIAVRMSLGANGWSVLTLISTRLLIWTAIGLAAGIAGSIASAQLLRSYLYGSIQPTDVLNLLTTCGLFLAVIAVAALPPLRRALATDPARALRAD